MPPRTEALRLAALAASLAAAVPSGCATLADGTPGLDNPPTLRAGPFRLLKTGELGENRSPPNTVDDGNNRLRDPGALDVDGDPSTFDIEGYFAASVEDAAPEDPPARIARLHATDGRSFDRNLEFVLEPDQPWEGGVVGAPSVILAGDPTDVEETPADEERLLFYEGAGGIGLAHAAGATGEFVKEAEPVLTAADVPWSSIPPKSPGAVRLPDGTFRLYFEARCGAESCIGVASSIDGVNFTDPVGGPVLRPDRDPTGLDSAYVGSPSAVVAESAESRAIVQVYFTGIDDNGKNAIRLAARFADAPDEGLEKNGGAMFRPSGGVAPHEPVVVRFDAFTIFFATQKPGRTSTDVVVVAGVSPGDTTLPPASTP
ncbi:MAG: hypothetical protein U0271_08910 [Polyangiaceae bacterium]